MKLCMWRAGLRVFFPFLFRLLSFYTDLCVMLIRNLAFVLKVSVMQQEKRVMGSNNFK